MSEVVTINEAEIDSVPDFNNFLDVNYLLGVSKENGQVKLLLNIDYVLSNNELNTLLTTEGLLKTQDHSGDFSLAV